MKLAKTYYNVTENSSRFHVEEGGTRSGKTYSILTVLAELCWRNKGGGLLIDITRVNGPAIDAGPLHDWKEILDKNGWLDPSWHSKRREYNLFGNEVRFFSVDQSGKMRGRKRNILYMNEASRFSYDAFQQLNMRTTDRVIMDYNPDEVDHWIYDKVLTRENAQLFRTTYKDNPHLSPELVSEIEAMKDLDEWYWKVFGLGERAANPAQIYRNWQVRDKMPNVLTDNQGREKQPQHLCIGLDFGFSSHPSAAVLITEGIDREIWLTEILYEKEMTNTDLAGRLKEKMQSLGLDERRFPVVCDSAEPKSIKELRLHGINAYAAQKGPDSVRQGIQFVQQHRLILYGQSENLQKELTQYRWQVSANGNTMNNPVKNYDHLTDALRYGITWSKQKEYSGKYAIGAY